MAICRELLAIASSFVSDPCRGCAWVSPLPMVNQSRRLVSPTKAIPIRCLALPRGSHHSIHDAGFDHPRVDDRVPAARPAAGVRLVPDRRKIM